MGQQCRGCRSNSHKFPLLLPANLLLLENSQFHKTSKKNQNPRNQVFEIHEDIQMDYADGQKCNSETQRRPYIN